LRSSQAAWLQYKAANCPLMGAIQGGSNLWITHFAAIRDPPHRRPRRRIDGRRRYAQPGA